MKKLLKDVKKISKKIKRYLISNYKKSCFRFTKYYDKKNINENEILIQSYDGSSISGNPYYLLLELNKNEISKNMKKYIVSNKKSIKIIKSIVEKEKLINTEVIKIHTKKYCKILATAKYLINNSTFPTYFIKKEGQVYLNTWHGTPLKAMGRNIVDSPHELGNTLRNFLMSDYLLYQNDFMYEKMKSAYMLDNIFTGKYVISGYPRNDIFFIEKDREIIRKKLNLEGKQIIVYMPTWRGTTSKKQNEEQEESILKMIDLLEKELDNNTVVFLKIHNLASAQINYNNYTKIKPFPTEYETYQFLNIADCLITDYSSVMFDYANTGKKVILYIYDFEEYTKNRGFYLNVKEDMPFTKVYTKEQLCDELKTIKKYEKYESFKKEFCQYDSIKTSKNVCDLLLTGKTKELKIIQGNSLKNDKENILIFTGALLKNGITSALKGLINNIDLTKYNYYLTFYRNPVKKNSYVINTFPKECNYIPIQGQKDFRIKEFIASILFFKINVDNKWIRKQLEILYKREIKRIYPNINFDYAIDFCGYDKQPINFISYMNNTYKIRFTHSNLQAEEKTRNNIHIPSLKFAYRTYDKVAIVREGMEEEIQNHFKDIKPKTIQIVHNCNDIKGILADSNKKIEFSDKTISNYEIEKIEEILNDKTKIKFINIGRFSVEKGQIRLINAFKKIQQENQNAYLILIGGHGPEFSKIMNKIEKENIPNIIVIKNIDNPSTILKRCNLFILSSFYEGLPMTIMESLILKVPVLSVNIEGPRKFLEKGYAYLVENSEQGLEEGIKKYINNEYSKLKEFDAQRFNQEAIEEFYRLLDK